MALARDLDSLEHHLERYGSVVAQQPSVWGQARLTRHREEYEKEMAQELPNFKDTLQGSLSRSDQAYYANATALSAAVSGRAAGIRPPRIAVSTDTSTTAAGQVTPLKPPDLPAQTETFAAFDKMTRTDVRMGKQLGFAFASTGISLEPTVHLDQKSRFLNHLNELRRINEGDDTADSPGYALNLVRIPVSVLPGSCTMTGYGAEVTMTLNPYLSDELLPTTFRNLVINDLVDQISVPLTQLLNDVETISLLLLQRDFRKAVQEPPPVGATPKDLEKWVARNLKKLEGLPSYQQYMLVAPKGKGSINALLAKPLAESLRRRAPTIPVTKLRRARLPFPPSRIPDIFGEEPCLQVALSAYKAFEIDPASKYPCNGSDVFVHLPDVQGYLGEELAAAYRFLAAPCNRDLWNFCTPELVSAIRGDQLIQVAQMRNQFLIIAGQLSGQDPFHTTSIALAWAIIVESALLNDQLIQDMREASVSRGCACARPEPLPYFLPDPPPEARAAFNDYVRCRWPIMVFALDPVAQQQNIADVFSARREMQLAMSLAFVSGNISGRRMMRFARRIEFDMETIDLNNTAVGFSHGSDTFGWRFYPRYQTPDIDSNFTVFFRDLLLGGPSRNALLRQRRLEPGQRECIAIVIMPSFVPYATLNVSSSFFRLTSPKCKEPDLTDVMKLSKRVKAIQTCGPHVGDADCYRDGDLYRLLERAKQIETRLPLQSTVVQIPYENTLGGFAMFNTGITDLAPELTGWYGASYVRREQDTAVFLVGNHFSVHQTRVIAGGQEVKTREMLSRQVMKVVIPAGVVTVKDGDREYVDVHVATPYGVTPHLLIPVCPPAMPDGAGDGGKQAAGPRWGPPAALEVSFVYSGLGIAPSKDPQFRPKSLTIDVGEKAPEGVARADLRLTFSLPSSKVQIAFKDKDAIPFDAKSRRFTVSGTALAAKLLEAFRAVFGPEAVNPPHPVVATAELTYRSAAGFAMAEHVKTANNLTVTWIQAPQ
jgi:hypothetical protein